MTATPGEQCVGFEGFERADRPVGIRNRVLVLPSVICSREITEQIAQRVPGAVGAPHDHGCGQIGVDREQTSRTFLGVGINPNVAGTVVVGLGCESIGSGGVATDLQRAGVPVRELSIQGTGGTEACLEAGTAAATDLVESAQSERQIGSSLGDLTVGVVSGDLASTTRETADPLVGDLARAVVAAGGRVVVAGNERLVTHPEEAPAAADGPTAAAVDSLCERHGDQPGRATRVHREAAELTFEAVTRFWGGLPVVDVLDYGERATHDAGLAVVDAPSRFEEAATGLAAAGAQIVVHATAEGVTTGHPVVPVLKVSGDPETVATLREDIDVDATTATVDDLQERVRAVAGGERSCAERHGLTAFAITRVGPSM